MGTRLVRVNLWWGGPNGVARSKPLNPANPADPAYDWATYDRTVRYALAYKMATIFTVIGTPDWANGGQGWNRAPTKAADLQAFVTAAARRYSGTFKGPDGATIGRVSKWIAWNEPNNPVFLKPQFVRSGHKWVIQSAKDYARMCNAVVKAVKIVHYTNQVACGVTSPRGNNQPGSVRTSVSPLAFMRAMKLAGATGFDAYAHHPYYGYPSETPNTKPPPGKHGLPPTAVTLGNFEMLTKELQRLYGNMRIWVTEYGYQTNPPDKTFGVTPAQAGPLHAAGVGQAQGEPKGRHDDLVPPARSDTGGSRRLAVRGLHGERRPQALARDVRAPRVARGSSFRTRPGALRRPGSTSWPSRST